MMSDHPQSQELLPYQAFFCFFAHLAISLQIRIRCQKHVEVTYSID